MNPISITGDDSKTYKFVAAMDYEKHETYDAANNNGFFHILVGSSGDETVRQACTADPSTMKGIRAYYKFDETAVDRASSSPHEHFQRHGATSAKLRFAGFEEGTTGLQTVKFAPEEAIIYDAQGRMLGTDTSKLSKGIYIRAGKKFMIK